MSSARIPLIVSAALALVTLIVYWPARRFEFLQFDDPGYLHESAAVREGLNARTIVGAFAHVHQSNWHPATTIVYLIERQLFGLEDARGYHVVNIVVHALNGGLLCIVMWMMTGFLWRSAVVAALFALHPLHVESVAWISELKDVLSMFFMLLSVGAYVMFVDARGEGLLGAKDPRAPLRCATGRSAGESGDSWIGVTRTWYVVMLVLYALALMSKPMVVTLPVILLLLDYYPLQRDERWTKLALEKIPLFFLAAASSVATILAQKWGGAFGSLEKFPISDRVANAMLAYATYLQKTVFPTKLTPYYPYGTTVERWIPAMLVLIAITAIVIVWGRRRRYLIVGWAWYLITLLPVIGLVQVGAQAMAERYTYISLVGVFWMAVWGMGDMARLFLPLPPGEGRGEGDREGARLGARPHPNPLPEGEGIKGGSLAVPAILTVGAVVVLGALTVRTREQLAHWRNTQTLFEHALSLDPNNARARFYVGDALRQQRRFDDAAEQLYAAVKIEPNSTECSLVLGMTLAEAGRLDAAMPILRRAATLADMELEKKPDVPRLIQLASAAHQNIGVALARKNEFAAAAVELERALQLDPNNLVAREMLAPALLKSGQLDRAADEAQRFASVNPAAAAVQHFEIGLAMRQAGRAADAAKFYRRAIELNPRSNARNNLAWLLATSADSSLRSGAEAVRLAESMKQQLGDLPEVLDTLAAAYAEAGDFPKAIEVAQRAVFVAVTKNQAELEKEIRARLELYRAGKAYREIDD